MIFRLISFIVFNLLQLIDKFYQDKSYVFMFHDITLDKNINNEEFKIELRNFNIFIDILKEKKYITKSLDEIIQSNNKKSFHFTFDDANDSVYSIAYPILKELQIYFTVFINIEYIDKPGYLSSSQIIELSNCKFCKIGSHGMNHSYFRFMSKPDVLFNLSNSKSTLEKLIGKNVEYFAYPYGSLFACSFANIFLAKSSDFYKACFSTIPVSLKIKNLTSEYFLPRVNITDVSFKNILDD